jgi:hypothetical protein
VDGKHAFFVSSAIDKKKWTAMSAVVPEHLAPRVSFDVRSISTGAASSAALDDRGVGEDGGELINMMGIIRLADVAHEGNDHPGHIETTILQLLRPLAQFADDLLDKAVNECDPDKEAKASKAAKEEGVGAETAAKTTTRAPRKRKTASQTATPQG